MGLNVKIYNIVYDNTYSLRYKSGDYPYPENIDSTFTLYGTGLTNSSITLSGLSFDTQYWIKMTDDSSGRYIIKNIYIHDSKAYPCYDTLCFDVVTDEVIEMVGVEPELHKHSSKLTLYVLSQQPSQSNLM